MKIQLKFLIKESSESLGYTKIAYKNNIWIIEGESSKFEFIEIFENNLLKSAGKVELEFIKGDHTNLNFQYKAGDIVWN